MRFTGKITDWDATRGFGFAASNGGLDRVFVHINEFKHRSRRPTDGDLISYRVVRDTKGRLQAREIQYAGEGSQPRRFPRAAVGIATLLGLIGATAFGFVPFALTTVYFVLSLVSFIMYASDKAAAESDNWRTPEDRLHLADLLGGWPGALVAQQKFHHKTSKLSFQVVFCITVVLNIAAAWWLLSTGILSELIQLLS